MKGFHQTADLDYAETFSPIVKLVTIRMLLILALAHGWTIRQIDINNVLISYMVYYLTLCFYGTTKWFSTGTNYGM